MTDATKYVEWFHKKIHHRLGGHWPEMKVDHAELVKLIDTYDIKSIFEIGTWEGITALLMWLHPNVDRLKTIDICKEYGHGYHNPENGVYAYHLQGTNAKFQVISSLDYVPAEGEQWDMVFVEGNHEYEFVKHDFGLALKFNPKIVVFHDIANGNPGVDQFIAEQFLEPTKKFVIIGNGSCIGYYINRE